MVRVTDGEFARLAEAVKKGVLTKYGEHPIGYVELRNRPDLASFSDGVCTGKVITVADHRSQSIYSFDLLDIPAEDFTTPIGYSPFAAIVSPESDQEYIAHAVQLLGLQPKNYFSRHAERMLSCLR